MKKSLGLFLLLTLALIMAAGCGSETSTENTSTANNNGGEDPQTEGPETEAQEPEAQETIELSLGTIREESDPTTVSAQKFAELVEEKSGGSIQISVHANSTLGGFLDMVSGMQTGTVDMVYEGISSYPWIDGAESFNIMVFPFFWESYEDMVKVLESPEFEEIFEQAAQETGVRVISAVGDTEPRQLTANQPVHNAEDFEGLSIRTAESKVVQETMQALGAQPVVIELADLYMALRQGTADAQENGFITVQNSSFHEVQDYVMQTDYIRDVKAWYISDDVWNSLTTEQQEIMEEASIEAGELQTELAREQMDEALDFLKENMEYIEPDLDSIRAELEDTFESFDGDLWPEGLLDTVNEILAR